MLNTIISRELLRKVVSDFRCDLPLHSGVTLAEIHRLQGNDEVIRLLAQLYINAEGLEMNPSQLIAELKLQR